MIDYLTVRITLPRPLPHAIDGGHFTRTGEAGEVEQSTARRKRVIGSHEATLHIRAQSTAELELTGNPAKFVQGHNLYGSSDPVEVLWAALLLMEGAGALPCSLASLGLSGPLTMASCTEISRIDCTVMLLGLTWFDVETSLRSLRVAGRLRDRGASGLPHPWDRGGGVTFGSAPGKSMRHRSITFYSKGEDVKVHPLPALMANDSEVMEWVKRSLRCEVRLGSNYLRKTGLRAMENWTAETALDEWKAMMERVDMNGSDERPEGLEKLPAHLQVAYAAWLSGADLSTMFARRTYYRKRAEILKAIDVDIAIPKPTEPTAQIVPIKRVIELEPASRPSWADRIDAELAAA